MNWRLIKKDFALLLRNPITYIGVIAMIAIVVMTVFPYLRLYENLRSETQTVNYSPDGDVIDGYVPTPDSDRWDHVTQAMTEVLHSDYGMSEEDAKREMDDILSKGWTIEEIRQYFIDEYDMPGFTSLWNDYAYQKADYKEMQQYLNTVFDKQTYTALFARKYSDYLGIASILFTMMVFTVLLMRDMKKKIYSFIHTKPISGRKYVLGKLFTGVILVVLIVSVLSVVIDFIAVYAGNQYGFKTDFLDIWKSVIIYNFPGILLTGCIMLFIALVFKNIVPAIPAMLLYFMYANIGTIDSAEGYHYQVKPGVIFIRFPQQFTETEIPSGILINQIFLLVLAAIFIIGSILIWERRRDA